MRSWFLIVCLLVGCDSSYSRTPKENDCIELQFACIQACSSTTMVQDKTECMDFCIQKKNECRRED
jgi:hypothetical protein